MVISRVEDGRLKRHLKSVIRQISEIWGRFVISQARNLWVLDQFVPVQTISRSIFYYEPQYFGQHEYYEGPKSCELFPPNPPKLTLNTKPTLLATPYFFCVPNAASKGFVVADPQDPDRLMIETYADVKWIDRDTFWPDKGRRIRRAITDATKGRAPDHETGYLFSTRGWDNYYHFLIDACAKFVDLDNHGAIDPSDRLVVAQPLLKFQEAYLPLVGIDPDKIVNVKKEARKFGQLKIGSPRRQVYVASKHAVNALRGRVLDNLGIKNTGGTRRLYVSRSKATSRRIINEDALWQILERNGFEMFSPEGLSVEQQIRSFADAEMIVAPHGAGLANLIYASQPKVVELLPVDRWDYGYFISLTDAVSGQYTGLVSRPENAQNDFKVDLAQLERAVSSDCAKSA